MTRLRAVPLGAVIFVVACGKSERDSAPARADSTGSVVAAGALPKSLMFTAAQVAHGGVRWEVVTIATSSVTATVPGEVVPNEDRTARLGAPARGRVVSVWVRPGDRVNTGQVLVTLQSPDAGMAQSDVAKADAEVGSRQAEAKYAASARARADRLLALKAIPRQDYDRAIADDEHARAALAQAQAEAQRARTTAAQLSVGSAGNGEIVIRAPAAGVVLTRAALPGTVVEAGTSLVVITDPASLWLTVNAPEPMTALFHRGSRLRFTVPAYPADTFVAQVDAIGAGLEADTRTLSVRALVSSRDRLKPEMLASVIVDAAGGVPAALLPDDAVQLLRDKSYVFLARPDGKGGAQFEPREVVVGSRSGGRVTVVRGLAPGDIAVVAGAFAVKAEFQKATMPKMEM
jgi:cobalt-zinc-cadmium efflux system membrane fusion protein